MAIVLLVAAVVGFLLYLLARQKRQERAANAGLVEPPWTASWYLPLLGETLDLVADPKAFLAAKEKEFGPVFNSSLIGKKHVTCVCGGDAVRSIFKQDGKMQFWFPGTIGHIFGRDNPFFNPDLHSAMRGKLSLPMLSSTALERFMPVLKEEIERALDAWEAEGSTNGHVDVVPAVKALAWRISLKYVLGAACTPNEDKVLKWHALFKDVNAGTRAALPWPLPGTVLAKSLKARDLLMAELVEMIEKTRQGLSDYDVGGDSEGNDIDTAHHGLTAPLLFDSSLTLTNEELAITILSLLFAANDTTSDTVCGGLCRLYASNEELSSAREQMKEACNAVDWETFGQRDLDQGTGDWAYIEGTIREICRLWAPSTFTFRVCKDPVTYKDMYLPANSTYLIALVSVLRDPSVFPDPMTFNPRRYDKEDGNGLESLKTLVSFGGGKHSCLGKRFAMTLLRALFIRLFQRFPDWDMKDVVHAKRIDAEQNTGLLVL